MLRPLAKGQCLSWDDVAMATDTDAWRIRHEMQQVLRPADTRD